MIPTIRKFKNLFIISLGKYEESRRWKRTIDSGLGCFVGQYIFLCEMRGLNECDLPVRKCTCLIVLHRPPLSNLKCTFVLTCLSSPGLEIPHKGVGRNSFSITSQWLFEVQSLTRGVGKCSSVHLQKTHRGFSLQARVTFPFL